MKHGANNVMACLAWPAVPGCSKRQAAPMPSPNQQHPKRAGLAAVQEQTPSKVGWLARIFRRGRLARAMRRKRPKEFLATSAGDRSISRNSATKTRHCSVAFVPILLCSLSQRAIHDIVLKRYMYWLEMILFNLQRLRQDTPTNAIGIGISKKVSRTFCFSFLLCNAALLLLVCTPLAVHGYCTGDLHRRDIAGVWSLKSQSFLPTLHPAAEDTAAAKQQTEIRPMKEFTKWPKRKKKPLPAATAIEEEELLLMLRDDGSFIQYGKHRPGEDGEEIKRKEKEKLINKPAFVSKAAEETVESFQEDGNGEEEANGVMKGTWDFIDGKLILAADRPEDLKDLRAIGHDTILSGDVVVKAEESLEDRSTIEEEKEAQPKVNAKKKDYGNNDDGSYDVHISVPEGTVEIGKFFYPKNHPSFFDQPIYSPTKTGSFQLRQVLGGLNTRTKKDDAPVEKFKVSDLQGKRYFLTTYPLKQRKPKRMADIDPHKREEAKRKAAEEEARPVPIRAVEIELFANMTFSTLGGLGDAKILRGKWNLIGENRDQLWMQVFRFGFGRAVSGSTYSEGMGLTHEDQKAYWGRIIDINDPSDGGASTTEANSIPTTTDSKNHDEPKTVEINGSVLDGWGLEPLPVARFTMIEETQEYDDDDDDDEDEADLFRQSLENYADFSVGDDGGSRNENSDNDIDPFPSLDDAFQ